MIEKQIKEKAYDFIRLEDKQFIVQFTHALEEMGYTYNDTIGKGYCWGLYMMIFRKANVKSKNVVARIYIRQDSIALRLFLNNVTKHAAFISTAPAHIKKVFTGNQANCQHCSGDNCRFQKKYEIDQVAYEKCNGSTFTFEHPPVEFLPDYLSLFQEFYSPKRVKR